MERTRIDLSFSILTDCLHVTLQTGTRKGFFTHNEQAEVRINPDTSEPEVVRPAILQIICPPDCDFSSAERQLWLEKAITEGIRAHAKAQLIPRLRALAEHFDVELKEIKVNSSRGRWGSCSCRRTKSRRSFLSVLFGPKEKPSFNINLSLFTLLLPYDVQRLILLHELMHTRHMNHSAAFHADLNQWLDGKEKALEAKLKRYSTNIYSFQSFDRHS